MTDYSLHANKDFHLQRTWGHKDEAAFSNIAKPMKVAVTDYFGVEKNFIPGNVIYNVGGVYPGTAYVSLEAELKKVPKKVGFLLEQNNLLSNSPELYVAVMAFTMNYLYKIPVVALKTERIVPEVAFDHQGGRVPYRDWPFMNRQFDIWYGKKPDNDKFDVTKAMQRDQFQSTFIDFYERAVKEVNKIGSSSSKIQNPSDNENNFISFVLAALSAGLVRLIQKN